MGKVKLKIVTPEKLIYEDEVSEFSAYTKDGKVGILPRHIPLVAALAPGEITIKKDKIDLPMAISGGILEVKPFKMENGQAVTDVVILADHLEFAGEIDLEKSKEAYERAQQAMKEKASLDDVEFARLQAKIEKEFNRIKIGSKYRK